MTQQDIDKEVKLIKEYSKELLSDQKRADKFFARVLNNNEEVPVVKQSNTEPKVTPNYFKEGSTNGWFILLVIFCIFLVILGYAIGFYIGSHY